MKRKFESGASERRRKQLDEASANYRLIFITSSHVFIYWNYSLNSSSGLGLSDSLRGPGLDNR